MIFLSGKENFTGMELAELLNQINPAPIYEHFQRGIYSLNVQISPDKSLRLKLDLPRKDLFSQAEINYFQSNPRELAVLLSLCHLIKIIHKGFSQIALDVKTSKMSFVIDAYCSSEKIFLIV